MKTIAFARQLTMMELHVKRTVKRVKMIERSLFSARRCFVENLFRSGKMPSSEYSVLLEWYRQVARPLVIVPG